MLELVFGSQELFAKALALLVGSITLFPLIVYLISAGVSNFVTRGENTVRWLYDYTVVEWMAGGHDPSLEDLSFGILFHFVVVFLATVVGGGIGAVLWITPVWVYILAGVIVGVLLTARFAYTLKSKFDKHLEKLHQGADKKDYDVKW